MINLIIAVDKFFGFSKNNIIPWYCKEDLLNFKNETLNNIVIMGKNTFLTLKKPLINRINVVISSSLNNEEYNNIHIYKDLFISIEDMKIKYPDKKIYICGGLNIYNTILKTNLIDKIIITYININYECDLFLDIKNFYNYKLNDKNKINDNIIIYSLIKKNIEDENINFPLKIFNNEFNYLNVLNFILKKGILKNTRNGNVLSVFSPPEMKFNLLEGFPLLTTKKMNINFISSELFDLFINGKTDSNILSKKGNKIWDANTTREFLDSRKLSNYEIGDMGPMYGWNWRHFGAKYEGKDADYTNKGFDQLENLIHLIKTDPTSRRLLLTSFDPSKVNESVLPPCHSLPIQFYISDIYIDCKMTQRSGDMFLGVPYNIASTSLLLTSIAQLTGYIARYVIISLGDAHIYEEHIEQCKIQLNRCPYDLPSVILIKELKTLKDLEDLNSTNIILKNYKCHSFLKGVMKA